jgi:hypothetical protein
MFCDSDCLIVGCAWAHRNMCGMMTGMGHPENRPQGFSKPLRPFCGINRKAAKGAKTTPVVANVCWIRARKTKRLKNRHYKIQLSNPCPALRAHPVVQRDHPAANRTTPTSFFFQQVRFRPQHLPPPGVFHQADRITLAVTAVESFDHRAGKVGAI